MKNIFRIKFFCPNCKKELFIEIDKDKLFKKVKPSKLNIDDKIAKRLGIGYEIVKSIPMTMSSLKIKRTKKL